MNRVFHLIKKDFILDWRQQNPITGILLYLATLSFTTYMAFGGFISLKVWNALLWIVLLFTGIQAVSKSFLQEQRRTHYYFFTCKPSEIITAKLIYSSLYLMACALLTVVVFSLLFGSPITHFGLFALNLILGTLGISSTFTMVSAIAFRTQNQALMMAVLGFPVTIPILILSISNTSQILDGFIWMQVQGNVLALLSTDVIIIALAYLLFPFTWKS